MMIGEKLSNGWFHLIHRTNLVYNTCWEDPRLDREALTLGPDDRVLVITSAGCNALDYVLDNPQHVFAVDVNPRQNALLELKMAGIRALDFGTFFALFGRGRVKNSLELYRSALRDQLSEEARSYWDRHVTFFDENGRAGSFYFRGTAGYFARTVNRYLDRIARVREPLEAILAARSIDEQRDIYDGQLRNVVWSRWLRWVIGRDATLSLLGVPRPQRQQVERNYVGGIAQFIEDSVEAVFARLPLHDNYFWRVYLTGEYSSDCCPEYLKRHNFELLKRGLVDRISTHTDTVAGFLRKERPCVSRFVLLDHMDWLATFRQAALADEWQAIVDCATPDARVLWRSGGLHSDFVNRVPVHVQSRPCRLGELLTYNHNLAARLHPLDRVHTYGSFWIARLAVS
jgi:S-adenosylmethionine-diacylglycerol 3-amino-3-carboxypropyl transferase